MESAQPPQGTTNNNNNKGMLKGRVVEGLNLVTRGSPSLYVIVRLDKAKFQTKSIKGTTNPKWDEKFTFYVGDVESSKVEVEVWITKKVDHVDKNELLGKAYQPICGLYREEVEQFKMAILGDAVVCIRLLAIDFGKRARAATPISRPTVTNRPHELPVHPHSDRREFVDYWSPSTTVLPKERVLQFMDAMQKDEHVLICSRNITHGEQWFAPRMFVVDSQPGKQAGRAGPG